MSGILLVDKQRGPTSHDLVRWARRVFGTRSVGHAGTLDPMATGVLVLLIDQGTKLAPYLSADDKVYEAEICLGSATDTLDAQGEIVALAPLPHDISDEKISAILRSFGEGYLQEAPLISAIKIDGKSSMQRVRDGEYVEAKRREVLIRELRLLELSGDKLRLRVDVGKGFYVRSLARDIGARLGIPAHLSGLRRIRSGVFEVGECVSGAALYAAFKDESLRPSIRAAAFGLVDATRSLPRVDLTESGAIDIMHGRSIDLADTGAIAAPPLITPPLGAPLRFIDPTGALRAIGEIDESQKLRVLRGFNLE